MKLGLATLLCLFSSALSTFVGFTYLDTPRGCMPATFSGEPANPFTAIEGVVVADPADACSTLNNADKVAGKVLLVTGENCYFTEKAAFAEAAGAKFVVVYTSSSGMPPYRMSAQPGFAGKLQLGICMTWTSVGEALKDASTPTIDLRSYRNWAATDETYPAHLTTTLLLEANPSRNIPAGQTTFNPSNLPASGPLSLQVPQWRAECIDGSDCDECFKLDSPFSETFQANTVAVLPVFRNNASYPFPIKCYHTFHVLTYLAQRNAASAVLFIFDSSTLDLVLPYLVPYDINISTFTVTRSQGDMILNDMASFSRLSAGDRPLAIRLPKLLDGSGPPFLADEEMDSDTAITMLRPSPSFIFRGGHSALNPYSWPGGVLPATLVQLSPGCQAVDAFGKCAFCVKGQLVVRNDPNQYRGRVAMIQENVGCTGILVSGLVEELSQLGASAVVLVNKFEITFTQKATEAFQRYPIPVFNVRFSDGQHILERVVAKEDVVLSLPPLSHGLGPAWDEQGYVNMALTEFQVTKPTALKGFFAAGQATYNPSFWPVSGDASELDVVFADIKPECRNMLTCRSCDVTTGVFQDPFALQGKAVVVLEDEAQCVHPSSQLLRHVQIAGGKALLYVPTKESSLVTLNPADVQFTVIAPAFVVERSLALKWRAQAVAVTVKLPILSRGSALETIRVNPTVTNPLNTVDPDKREDKKTWTVVAIVLVAVCAVLFLGGIPACYFAAKHRRKQSDRRLLLAMEAQTDIHVQPGDAEMSEQDRAAQLTSETPHEESQYM